MCSKGQRSTCNISGPAYTGRDNISSVRSEGLIKAEPSQNERLELERKWSHLRGARALEDSFLKGQGNDSYELIHRTDINLASPNSNL